MLRADRAHYVYRADRMDLPRKVVQSDGSVRYHAILARADAPMQYSWGTEVATEQALSDPEYLAGLRGISLITVKSATHQNGKPINVRDDARAVGTVLDATWHADEKLVRIEMVVNDRETLDDIDAGRILELSEAYLPTVRTRADGVIEQLKRQTNHVALVEEGRMPGTGIRADRTEDTEMTPEQIAQIATAVAERMRADSEEETYADKLEAMEKERADAMDRADKAEKMLADIRKALGMNADSADGDIDLKSQIDAMVADAVRADSAILDEARELGVEIPDESTPATRLRDVAVALGADATRADSADYARSFIDGRKSAPRPTAAQRFEAAAKQNPNTGGVVRRVS